MGLCSELCFIAVGPGRLYRYVENPTRSEIVKRLYSSPYRAHIGG